MSRALARRDAPLYRTPHSATLSRVAGLRLWTLGAFFLGSVAACDGDVLVGEFVPEGTASQGGTGGATATTTGINDANTTTTSTSSGGTAGAAGAPECIPRSCGGGPPYACGNCLDDDDDGLIDADDPDCLGPCQNNELSYYGNIPGQSGGNCGRDCYFDSDSGAGNDDCHWDHRCDPREPNAEACPYDPGAGVGAPPVSCEEAASTASDKCLEKCLPLVPNGCDCFGCCEVPGAPTPVWLGSEVNGQGSCDRFSVADPDKCRPCTLNTHCFNPCDDCEVCVGRPKPPPNCGSSEMPQECPEVSVGCGLPGQSACLGEYYCITGCCTLIIK